MNDLKVIFAKLEGLRGKVISRLKYVSMDMHFEATTVLELFDQYVRLRDEINRLSPGLYSDLLVVDIPKVPDENGENRLKGCVPSWYLKKLQEEIDCIFTIRNRISKDQDESIRLSNWGDDPTKIIEHVCTHFHSIARQLRERHNGRKTLDIADEYDVQDLLHALLRLFFEDVRTEEWTPSYAGSSARVDFLLKKEQVVVEVKKTRASLRGKQLGDQLINDIARYKGHSDCSTLYCFVYDPEGLIGNPRGIESDLSREDDGFTVKVHIAPKGH